jgi:hypothetical protein
MQPTHNVLISTSSSAPTRVPSMPPPQNSSPRTLPGGKTAQIPIDPISIYTFPSGNYVTIPAPPDTATYKKLLHQFIKGYVLPVQVHPDITSLDKESAKDLRRDISAREDIPYSMNVSHAMILICGHANRDIRCGAMGPLLQAEFEEKLAMFDVDLITETPSFKRRPKWVTHGEVVEGEEKAPNRESVVKKIDPDINKSTPDSTQSGPMQAKVAQISHIGGHKYAGNVIIYIPSVGRWKNHPLAGKGIWYGRVEPWHVEGIIEQTIKQGFIIKELFRGGVNRAGDWTKRLMID